VQKRHAHHIVRACELSNHACERRDAHDRSRERLHLTVREFSDYAAVVIRRCIAAVGVGVRMRTGVMLIGVQRMMRRRIRREPGHQQNQRDCKARCEAVEQSGAFGEVTESTHALVGKPHLASCVKHGLRVGTDGGTPAWVRKR
jgi:hypothetical protein